MPVVGPPHRQLGVRRQPRMISPASMLRPAAHVALADPALLVGQLRARATRASRSLRRRQARFQREVVVICASETREFVGAAALRAEAQPVAMFSFRARAAFRRSTSRSKRRPEIEERTVCVRQSLFSITLRSCAMRSARAYGRRTAGVPAPKRCVALAGACVHQPRQAPATRGSADRCLGGRARGPARSGPVM